MAHTYVDMPPEQGGARFGPWDGGVVHFGSDPSQCQVVMASAHGIARVHAALADQGDGTYTLQPIQRGYTLFAVQAGRTGMQPITTAVKMRPGDMFVLGNVSGPRFRIGRVERPTTAAPSASAGVSLGGMAKAFVEGRPVSGNGRDRTMTDRVIDEMARRTRSKMMTREPWRTMQRWYFRFRRGGWRSPQFIVTLILSLFGVMTAGLAGLMTLLWKLLD